MISDIDMIPICVPENAKMIRRSFKKQSERIDTLEAAIREHRDSFNDPKDCTYEDLKLWAVLEGQEQ